MAVDGTAKEDAKAVAKRLVAAMDPTEVDLLDVAFDALAEDKFEPRKADSAHGFAVAGASVLAGLIATVIGKLFYDTAKDVVKDELKDMLKGWSPRHPTLSAAQKLKLLEDFDRTAKRLKVPEKDRLSLRAKVEKVL